MTVGLFVVKFVLVSVVKLKLLLLQRAKGTLESAIVSVLLESVIYVTHLMQQLWTTHYK